MAERALSLDLAEQIVTLFRDRRATPVQQEAALSIAQVLLDEARPRAVTALSATDNTPPGKAA